MYNLPLQFPLPVAAVSPTAAFYPTGGEKGWFRFRTLIELDRPILFER